MSYLYIKFNAIFVNGPVIIIHRTVNALLILYIKMNVCLFVCLFVPYTNPHF
jgi:hypothetical protein